MLLRRVIPCLDVDKGRVVKGIEFVQLRDAGDPVELAARYEQEGADELVFLDITASAEKRETMVQLARHTADEVFIPFTIGGGIRSVEDALRVGDRANAAADGERDEDLVADAPRQVDDGLALGARRGDVEEDELVSALAVVVGGQLDRVAGVAQLHELDALDHAALVDVQARDDSAQQHVSPLAPHVPRRS